MKKIIILFFIISFLLLSFIKLCGATPMTDWHFDECSWNGTSGEVEDSSGNGYNGTAENGAVTDAGKLCKGGSFDGSNDEIDVNDGGDLGFTNNSLTITAWIRTTEQRGTIVSKVNQHSPWNGYVFAVGKYAGNDKLGFWIGNGASTQKWYLSNGSNVNDGNWHFVAVSLNGSVLKFYVDGVLDDTKTISGGNLQASTNHFKIGHNPGGGTPNFKGNIDEVKVFDQALSEAQINSIYNNENNNRNYDNTERQCQICDEELLADWHFDECSWNGTSGEVEDSSGNITGTAKNGANTDDGSLCKAGKFVRAQSEYLDMGADNNLNPGSDNWSISVWVKWEGGTGEQIIYNKENLYEAKIQGGKFYYAWQPHWAWDGGISLNSGEWTHFVVTYDHNEQKVYKNGALVYSRAQTGDISSNSNKHLIGARGNNNPRNYFNGMIDEMKIFRSALTSSDINTIYNNELNGKNYDGTERHCRICTTLIGNWRLDECSWDGTTGEVEDSSENGNNGTSAGDATTDSTGQICRGGNFDGNGDYINIPNSSSLNPTGSFTAMVWFKADSISNYNGIVSKLPNVYGANGYGWNIQVGTSNKIAALLSDSSGFQYIRSTTVPQTGVWYHVTLVHHDNDTNELYVNGTLEATNHHGIAFTGNPFQIGKFYTNTNSLYFDGLIDEVKIFDGALTSAEIEDIYNNEEAGRNYNGDIRICGVCESPLGEWRMDECSWDGTQGEVKDSTSNFNLTSENGADTTAGKLCLGGNFDGSDDKVEGTVDYTLNNAVTLSAWIKTNGGHEPYARVVEISRNDGDYHYSTALAYDSTGKIIRGWTSDAGGNRSAEVSYNLDSNGYHDNNWHHLVYTYDGAVAKLYVDSQLKDQVNTNSIADIQDAKHIAIGGYAQSNNYCFKGNIDEVKVFDKALSETDIQSLYNNEENGKNWDGSIRYCSICKNPLGEWRMDACGWNGTSGEVTDSSGNDLNGTGKNGTDTDEGQICRGGKFDSAQSQYIDIGNDNKLNPEGSDWSISVWVKWEGGTGEQIIYNKENLYEAKIQGGKFYYAWRPDWHWDGGISLNTGEWTHFVVTYNHNEQKVYKNGALVYSRAQTGDISSNSNKLLIGARGNNNPHNYFNGMIDEMKIFDSALSASDVSSLYNNEDTNRNWDGTIRNCLDCCSIDSLIIEPSDGDSNAIACEPKLVTVKAINSNGYVSTCFTGTVNLKIINSSNGKFYKEISGFHNDDPPLGTWSGDGSNDTDYNFVTNDNGQIKLWVRNSLFNGNTETIRISSSIGTIDNSTELTFYKNGFKFIAYDDTDHDNSSDNISTEKPIPSQLSCKPSDTGWNDSVIYLKAIKTDDETGACENALDNQTTVQMKISYISPGTGPANLLVNSTGISDSWTNKELTFNNQGKALLSLQYNDAGKIKLEARYDSDSDGTYDMFTISPPEFTVKPFGFYVYTTTANSEADNDSDSSVFKKAGESFNLSAKAMCWKFGNDNNTNGINDDGDDLSSNTVTGNYQDNATITHTLIAPSGGNSGSISVHEADFSNGEFSTDSQTFSEVGIIKFTVTDSDYLGAESIIGTSANIGRFIPYHFKITSKTDGELYDACSVFNYVGQTTHYSTNPLFTLEPQTKNNMKTENYIGDFFKLTSGGIAYNPPVEKISGITVNIEDDAASTLTHDSDNASATFDFGNDNISYIKDNNSKIAPFTPEFYFEVTGIDDGEVDNCSNCPDNITVKGLLMKYGRIKIKNNFGPETENLGIDMETQYWNGSRWVLNDDDSCTGLNNNDFNLYNFTENLNSGETTITGTATGITLGKGGITLSAPGNGNDGTVDIDLKTSAGYYNYLHDDSTPGTATFGIYRGRDRIIMWEEVPAD